MRLELDHLFVCCAAAAPEAERLLHFGLLEGPPNQHPGQGTANRRFAFVNAMMELLWVSDPAEAQNRATERTLLWERWSSRQGEASPFGFCVRPVDAVANNVAPPFTAWEYRPAYLPEPLSMYIGEAGVEEPMWFYLSFMRRAQREEWFREHPAGIREITRLRLTSPVALRSSSSRKIMEDRILTLRTGTKPLLEIEFDANQRNDQVDFRPELPIIFRF
jgi:hypothetical protein